jgi:hypothetical protein
MCAVCGQLLRGRQSRFCGGICKNTSTNSKHQTYKNQKFRGWQRKLQLVAQCGGKCSLCGYHRNGAALEFHHIDPSNKAFSLDARSLSNRTWALLQREVEKCVLVCSNCHAELHHPDFQITNTLDSTEIGA